mmetsp:Transcript_75592/g.179635  ORF Transcript_75592/g.179635 Transcript_75592/m.179635 type:complete len:89 (+) Transcript_75592:90-356(+)|eukprot:CAMPEP_0178428708 /NCGR_PEP_ID=MMETSP0689_2-20121128/30420_1 /TAXON_ID=160604 /ORGANISM="Amphidinium massartii, Strain CS-259" /LENGTH=88 /DNA_ID=CAMNT_0020050495 /DNA_START=87 /DNA_END=353 /DNA_ORIENTATION=+
MTSVVDTKVAVRNFKTCVKEKGASSCGDEKAAVVKGLSGIVKAECSPLSEDFFACFAHRYRLSSCSDATVAKLLKCQEQLSGTVLSAS